MNLYQTIADTITDHLSMWSLYFVTVNTTFPTIVIYERDARIADIQVDGDGITCNTYLNNDHKTTNVIDYADPGMLEQVTNVIRRARKK